MVGTYHSLRLGLGVVGVALPTLLWIGGRLLDGEPLRTSMSAYYYSPNLRNLFVGLLFVIGVGLYLYKGFSRTENLTLNFAGAFAVGVAVFPTTPPGVGKASLTWHTTFAVIFFVLIASVAIFRSSDTLSLIRDTRKAETFRMWYRIIGVLMIVFPH
jgi:hypothetical protein